MGQVEHALDLLAQVVRGQNSVERCLRQAVAAHGQDVRVGADEHSEVAVEAAHAADRLRPLEIKRVVAVRLLDRRVWEERDEVGLHAHRACAGAAAAVRGGERLVQVHVHRVEAHVARPGHAHEGVEVGAVVVEHRPGGVNHLGYIQDLALEQPQGVGVCQHQGRDPRRQLRLQVGQADAAVRP